LGNCTAASLAIRYEFLAGYKPEIFVKIGAPEIFTPEELPESKVLTKCFEKNLTETLDELKQDVVTGNIKHYEKIF